MNSNSYLMEAFLLGTLIFFGLTEIDITVNVNVTDKPIVSNAEIIETAHNIDRDAH